jgi:hypothetical protein
MDTPFHHKENVIACEKSMGNVNDYWKLLEPLVKLNLYSESKWVNFT